MIYLHTFISLLLSNILLSYFAHSTATASEQGLKFRRNFAEIRRKISFSLVTGKKNFGIFRKISFENSKFKKFRPKYTEIRRNLPKFRNEISFPLNTGICNENEMVNPDWSVVPGLAANDHARKYK